MTSSHLIRWHSDGFRVFRWLKMITPKTTDAKVKLTLFSTLVEKCQKIWKINTQNSIEWDCEIAYKMRLQCAIPIFLVLSKFSGMSSGETEFPWNKLWAGSIWNKIFSLWSKFYYESIHKPCFYSHSQKTNKFKSDS